MKHVTVTVFLLLALLKAFSGRISGEKIFSRAALTGSCVSFPCTFITTPVAKEFLRNNSCSVIWKTSDNGPDEFNSLRTREESAKLNLLHGKFVGDLLENNCSTILEDVPSQYDNVLFFFRLKCGNQPIFTRSPSFRLHIQDLAPQPTIRRERFDVFEGDKRDLVCWAPIFCSTSPPLLTWSPKLGNTEMDVTDDVKLVMRFKATYRHNNVKMTCRAIYWRQAGRTPLYSRRVMILRVLFAPKILPSSHCQDVQTGTLCYCVSQANPPPKLKWELSGTLLNPSDPGRPIINESIDLTTQRSVIFLQSLDVNDSLVCFSSNPYGTIRFAFNTSSPIAQKNVTILALSAMKAIVLLLLHVLLWYLCRCRKSKVNSAASSGQANNPVDMLDSNKNTSVDPIYYNIDHFATERAEDDGRLIVLHPIQRDHTTL
ncbi:sialic acid-binding Ig-like lectin 13 isoform X1 [Corythoichthys intestinalis]|uniref:sialic acid-binding Ig-like lectin 13 isoform X1 n=1 Tax=Corythoichthys intestinalis TaxID=161448 RepID=UPI0025A62F7D|nr:sialic acid-binding Ig-like lectin 13 isoform X1 [Corythoichthys intestinalis]XP_057689471.1 sialic acid-binding Ig-like lectin 13 isoform X1 [Corythoichthys intestinalis]